MRRRTDFTRLSANSQRGARAVAIVVGARGRRPMRTHVTTAVWSQCGPLWCPSWLEAKGAIGARACGQGPCGADSLTPNSQVET